MRSIIIGPAVTFDLKRTSRFLHEIIDEINEKHSIIEQDPLDSELRILDWIFYQVCSKEIKRIDSLDKEQTSYDDLLDSLRLSLKGYNIE